MPSPFDDLLERAFRIEREIEHELNQARQQWRYRIDAGRVWFEQDVHAAHQRLKQRIPAATADMRTEFWHTSSSITAMRQAINSSCRCCGQS